MSAYVIESQSHADSFGDLAVEYCHGDLRVELHCIQEVCELYIILSFFVSVTIVDMCYMRD